MKPVFLAFIASLAFGLSGPIIKIAFNKGMDTAGLTLVYALGMIIISWPAINSKSLGMIFPNTPALIFGLIAGGLITIGFKTNIDALATTASQASIIMAIMASYPVISSLLAVVFLKEASTMMMPKFILGLILSTAGVYLVTTSSKVAN